MNWISIIAISALLMTAAAPAIAQDDAEKDVCRISATTCLNKAEILQKRIKKMNTEIAKGSAKYTTEDLKILEQKLQETMTQLDKMEEKPINQLDNKERK
jgi:hypothetical protein